MATNNARAGSEPTLVTATSGIAVIPSSTPLTRLNYFDGKFLRAADLELEQRGLRKLTQLSNQSGGAGIVYGFRCQLNGSQLHISAGLAIDADGRVLDLPAAVPVDIADLIQKSSAAPAGAPAPQAARSRSAGAFAPRASENIVSPASTAQGADFYLITIGHAEAYQGEEEVYGAPCGNGCASSVDRPYIFEGVVVRAVPLHPVTPLPISTAVPMQPIHLRSRLASAYFADEQARIAHQLSQNGLLSNVWAEGARLTNDDVVLGVLCRQGPENLFVDQWIARRERMDAPAVRYWACRLAMRPQSVFLAQVQQFQDQLRHVLAEPTSQERVLIQGGIIELPSAGYLHVSPASSASVNQQVRRLLGEGVDLRFCVVRPDMAARALEEARHMERISLLEGLDDPDLKPGVDILVPDGQIVTRSDEWVGLPLAGALKLHASPPASMARDVSGAGRAERLPGGGGAFHYAGASAAPAPAPAPAPTPRMAESAPAVLRTNAQAAWLTMGCERDVFALQRLQSTSARLRLLHAGPHDSAGIEIQGTIEVHNVWGTERVRNVEGTLQGIEAWSQGQDPPETDAFLCTYQLRLTRSIVNNRTVEITANLTGGSRGDRELYLTWNPDDGTIQATWTIQRTGASLVVGAALKRDPEVLRSNGTAHLTALWGIELIQEATRQQGFADMASRLLFPEAPPSQEPIEVVATRDWVLFHRRRIEICDTAAQSVVPASRRRYQLFLLPAPDRGQAEFLREELMVLGRGAFTPVDIVEFAGGIPALASNPEQLAQAWGRHATGCAIFHAALARRPNSTDDGDDIALGRLDRLEQALAKVTPLDTEARSELMPALPPVPGTDGSIVLITLPQAHTVYWLTPERRGHIDALIETGNLDALLDERREPPFSRLLVEKVAFRPGMADITAGRTELRQQWSEHAFGGIPVDTVVSFVRANHVGTGTSELRSAQRQALASALDSSAHISSDKILERDLPDNRPIITFIRPKLVNYHVFVLRPRSSDEEGQMQEMIDRKDFEPLVQAPFTTSHGVVMFHPDAGPDASAKLLSGPGPIADRCGELTLRVRTGDPGPGILERQLEALHEHLQPNASEMALNPAAVVPQSWPVDAPGLVLCYVQPPSLVSINEEREEFELGEAKSARKIRRSTRPQESKARASTPPAGRSARRKPVGK